jgi:hypothetical protein
MGSRDGTNESVLANVAYCAPPAPHLNSAATAIRSPSKTRSGMTTWSNRRSTGRDSRRQTAKAADDAQQPSNATSPVAEAGASLRSYIIPFQGAPPFPLGGDHNFLAALGTLALRLSDCESNRGPLLVRKRSCPIFVPIRCLSGFLPGPRKREFDRVRLDVDFYHLQLFPSHDQNGPSC